MSKIIYHNRRVKAEKECADSLIRCEQLKKEFLANRLVVKPLWWTNLNKVKLEKDKEYLIHQGMVLINDISINKLITNLSGINKGIFKQQQLFHSRLDDTRTCKIIEHWKNEKCLMPPTVIWSSSINSIEIADGRHRINTAICLGETKIPIMISIYNVGKVLSHLDMNKTS